MFIKIKTDSNVTILLNVHHIVSIEEENYPVSTIQQSSGNAIRIFYGSKSITLKRNQYNLKDLEDQIEQMIISKQMSKEVVNNGPDKDSAIG